MIPPDSGKFRTWCEVSDGVRSMKLGAEGDCGGEEEDDDDDATAAGTATADFTAAAFPLMNGLSLHSAETIDGSLHLSLNLSPLINLGIEPRGFGFPAAGP